MRIMIVADAPKQRLALSDTVNKLGLDIVDSLSGAQLLAERPRQAVDACLVDVDDYSVETQEVIANTKPSSVIVGFPPAPYMSNSDEFDRWQKNLTRRLCDILALDNEIPRKNKTSTQPWRYVLFLGASMGGPEAVKEFLDNISPSLPLAVIIAQHFDGQMIHELPKILTRHNDWRCRIITTTQSLQAGTCLIAPIDKQIICDSNGRIILTKKVWQGEYRPNIGTLLKNASDVFGSQLIGVIFSGMGDDGSQFAKDILINNSFFWAQDPQTCKSQSQPQAFIDTGACQYVGSPKMLAERINKLFGYRFATIDLGKEKFAEN